MGSMALMPGPLLMQGASSSKWLCWVASSSHTTQTKGIADRAFLFSSILLQLWVVKITLAAVNRGSMGSWDM